MLQAELLISAHHDAQDETRTAFITATCASAAIASFIMGAFANLPVALAPGAADLPNIASNVRTCAQPALTQF